jgi:plastocyanin
MRGKLVGFAALLGAVAFSTPLQAQAVTGTVTFEGKAPTLKPVAMTGDPMCAKKHSGAVANESLVLGAGNTMGNVLVSVSKGLPAGKTYPAPSNPVVIDQQGCQYKPHVAAAMVNQPVKFLNSDGLLHNVHALPKVNAPFNQAMPATVKETTQKFAKAEAVFPIKCDVHPWMQSYMRVFDHPYYAVTSADGKFSIANLPAGTYTLEAWHEKLGTQTAQVTVGAGMKPVAFKFAAPAPK